MVLVGKHHLRYLKTTEIGERYRRLHEGRSYPKDRQCTQSPSADGLRYKQVYDSKERRHFSVILCSDRGVIAFALLYRMSFSSESSDNFPQSEISLTVDYNIHRLNVITHYRPPDPK